MPQNFLPEIIPHQSGLVFHNRFGLGDEASPSKALNHLLRLVASEARDQCRALVLFFDRAFAFGAVSGTASPTALTAFK